MMLTGTCFYLHP